MTDRLDPALHPAARLALAAVLDNADEHLARYLAGASPRRSLDHAEAGGIGVDLVPEVIGIVEQAWAMAQALVTEHPHVVNVGEGALGNALYAAIVKMLVAHAPARPPTAVGGLTTGEVEAIASEVSMPLAAMAASGAKDAP